MIIQVRKNLIAKEKKFFFAFSSSLKKKKTTRVGSYKVARKAIITLGRGKEVCARPQER